MRQRIILWFLLYMMQIQFYRNIISKLTIALLTISVFCSFVLRSGDLFALETGVQKDVAGKAFSCRLDGNQNIVIPKNHIVSDLLIAKPSEKGDCVGEPQYFKKTFLLLTFLNRPVQRPFYVHSRHHSLSIPVQDSVPAYLFYNNLRI